MGFMKNINLLVTVLITGGIIQLGINSLSLAENPSIGLDTRIFLLNH